jgi:ABC-type phosphate transport system substrate-binding protein
MTKPRAFVLILTGLVVNPAVAAEPATAYKVIVNAANAVTTLSRDDVSRIFLKKTIKWPNGQPVLPVDLPTSAPSRRAFSKGVLGRDPTEVGAYWNQVIFSGRAVPPPTKSSDSEVLSYVRDNPNAIGYVAADAKIDASVKVLTLRP